MVLVSENAGTVLVWNSNGRMSKTRLWRVKLGINGVYGSINEGWDESSVVHDMVYPLTA